MTIKIIIPIFRFKGFLYFLIFLFSVVYTDTAGYVNYYAWEGSRVAMNDLVYIVDETGRLNEALEGRNLGEIIYVLSLYGIR